MVILYFFIFFRAKLYSDMMLQVFFVVMQVQGWYLWANGAKDPDEKIRVHKLSGKQIGFTALFLVVCTAALGYSMSSFTDAAAPYLDAFTTSLSIAAQYWMNNGFLENWLLWIVADVIYLYLYFSKELYATTALYAVFLGLAVMGWLSWKKNLNMG